MDMNTKIAALLADKKNSRLALATALVARNAECEALRMRGAGAGSRPAPKVIARSEFAAQLDVRIAERKALLTKFFAANPQCRSASPAQLAEFAYYLENE